MTTATPHTPTEFTLGPTRIRPLITAAMTGGAYEIIEFRGGPGGVSPRAHFHRLADEAFIVLEGAIEVTMGDIPPRRLAAGESVHVPKGTPHVFRYVDPDTRFLAMLTPATRFDEYVPALMALRAASLNGTPDPEQLAALMARHDAFITAAV